MLRQGNCSNRYAIDRQTIEKKHFVPVRYKGVAVILVRCKIEVESD
jgi:hypothetical protein